MSLVLAPKMYGRKGGLVDFAGGNQSAGSLKEFFETNFMPCNEVATPTACLLYTSPSPRDKRQSRMPSSA